MKKNTCKLSPLQKFLDQELMTIKKFGIIANIDYNTLYPIVKGRVPKRVTALKIVKATEKINPKSPLLPSAFGIYDYE